MNPDVGTSNVSIFPLEIIEEYNTLKKFIRHKHSQKLSRVCNELLSIATCLHCKDHNEDFKQSLFCWPYPEFMQPSYCSTECVCDASDREKMIRRDKYKRERIAEEEHNRVLGLGRVIPNKN
jgi:hypothetical protein